MQRPYQPTQQQTMQWPSTPAAQQPPQPQPSPFFRHTQQQPQQQPMQAPPPQAMPFSSAPRWPQQPQMQMPPQATQQQQQQQQQQFRSMPLPPPFPPAAPARPSAGINLRYPQAQLQIRAYPPQQQQAQQQSAFPPPAAFVQRAAAAAAPNAMQRFPQQQQPQQYAMAPFPPLQQPRNSMSNGMPFTPAAAAAAAPSANRIVQQPRPPQQQRQPPPQLPQTPLQVGFMSGGRFIPSTPQALPAAAFAAPAAPQPQRPVQSRAPPPPPPLPSSISWRFDHSLRRWLYEPLGKDTHRPTSERVGPNKQYIADQLYWSRAMYESLREMLKEAEKKDKSKITVWSKAESRTLNNQLWHRFVPDAEMSPAQHFGVGSALLSSGTREWLPALGVDMSRPPALKLTGFTPIKPTRCKLSVQKAARVDAALMRAQRAPLPNPPSPSAEEHEVPESMVLSDQDDDLAEEKKVSGSPPSGDEPPADPDMHPVKAPDAPVLEDDEIDEDDDLTAAAAPSASAPHPHSSFTKRSYGRGHRQEPKALFQSHVLPHLPGVNMGTGRQLG